MKIFYTHDIFSTQSYGGVSRYFAEIIKQIYKAQKNVEIIAGLHFNDYIIELNQISKGIKIPSSLLHHYLVKCLNQIYQGFIIGQSKGSIVHQTYYSPFAVSSSFKVVTTIHDMTHEKFTNMRNFANPTSYAKRKSCERADRIICVSNSTKNDLVDIFNINPNRIDVIYHGSSFAGINFDKINCLNQKPYIFYVGSRSKYKNFSSLILAISKSSLICANFNLICFGGGAFSQKEKVEIAELKISNLVKQVSGSDQLLASYYANATALVYPSLYEGFGIPILEAMSLSCPVICANSSSLPEVAGDAAIYFDPTDIESIKHTLESSLFDRSILKDLSDRGHIRGRMFTWEKAGNQTLSVYESLAC